MKSRLSLSLALFISSIIALSTIPGIASLSVQVGAPLITFQNTSTTALQYSASNQLFSIDAAPIAMVFPGGGLPSLISGSKSLSIRLVVDNSGGLVSGANSNNFVLTGTLTHGADVYSGVLLTGDVTSFGFLESGVTDQYDMRFTPTGGLLLSFFSCGSIGIQVTSEASTFANSFTSDFNGRAKGNIGLSDTTPPTIVCPFAGGGFTNTVECQGLAGGLPGAYVTYPPPTVTDNCDLNPTIICTPPSGSFFALPPTNQFVDYPVICTAIDAAGNSNSCTFIIRIQDTLPPEFADTNNPSIEGCDTNHIITLTNDPGKCYATYRFFKPTAIDNCCPIFLSVDVSAVDENGATILLTDLGDGSVQGRFPVDRIPGGTSIVTTTASDERGNTSRHQCPIKVLDAEAPIIICPTNQTVQCTGGPVFFDEPTVSDNCPCVTSSCFPTNGSVLGVGPHGIVCTAFDCSGNSNQCTFFIVVQDTNAPAISCPPNITVQCGQSTVPTNTGFATARDTCDGNPKVAFTDVLSGTCPQILTRTWYTWDFNLNTNSCSQTITIQDTNKPTITVPGPINLCAGSSIPGPDLGSVNASDTCNPVTKGFVGDSYATNGNIVTITRTYRASDLCGNSTTGIQIIKLFAAPNCTITATNSINAGVVSNTASVADAGAGATYTWTITNGTITAGLGLNSITWTAGTNTNSPITIAITITTTNGCKSSCSKTINCKSGPTGYTTYTLGGWGAPPNGKNPATVLTNMFKTVYPSGFIIGGNYTIKLTSGLAIVAYLPDGGTGGVLKQNYLNPLTTSSGVFGSQVTALKLNIDASTKGYTKAGLSNLKIAPGNKLAGQTVAQVLVLANKVLGGNLTALPAGCSLSDLITVIDNINRNFDGGLVNNGFLVF